MDALATGLNQALVSQCSLVVLRDSLRKNQEEEHGRGTEGQVAVLKWGLSTAIAESNRRKTSLPLERGSLGFLSSLGIFRNQKPLLLESLGKDLLPLL